MKRRLGQQPIEADVGLLRVLLGKCGLAQPGGWLPFATYQAVPHNVTTSGQDLFAGTLSRACTIRYWCQAVAVLTTNNGSNYWYFELRRMSDNVSIKALNTSTLSPGAWELLSSTDLALSLTTAHKGIYIRAYKSGSPGPLYMGAPAVFVT
jgi:hypothetical protein